jgi:hypothetical protein
MPALCGLAACGQADAPGQNDSIPNTVATSGKTEIPLGEIPKSAGRVIESRQAGDLVIYALYASEKRKLEIKGTGKARKC